MLQYRYSCKFPTSSIFSSAGSRWRYPVGAASAESCTHPAKRDRCFPPPIAERQRLPNVGIICIGDSFALHFPRFGRSWTAAPKLALGPCLIYDTRQTKEGRQAAEPAYSKVFMLWFSSNAGNSYWVALPGTSMSLERSWTTLDKSCPVSGLGIKTVLW